MSHIIAQARSVATDSPPNGNPFDLCFALRNLRTAIRESQRSIACEIDNAQIEDLLRTVQGVAVAARATRFYAYGCICLNLAERIADLQRDCRGLESSLSVLCSWVEHSSQYVRHPAEPSVVIALLEQMNHPMWGPALGQAERDFLYRALLAPGV